MKIINREGSKYKYREEIIRLFPKHDTYIEGFLGTGAIFLNKPLAKYNIINDASKFIYKIFYFLRKNPEELYRRVKEAIIYDEIVEENQEKIEYQVIRALYSIFGSCTKTMVVNKINARKNFLERLERYKEEIQSKLSQSMFFRKDIFKFIETITLNMRMSQKSFIYLDPPYSVSKGRLGDNKGWRIEKLEKLILEVKKYRWQYAISEFNDTKVMELFEKHGLNIHVIGKSSGINRTFGHSKCEILATSY
ncbi:DNA adenine methylase [Borrelia turcica]|uniref:DNA adenine methylase n=1 Tax=Borrelia turcica TaxID=229155 RepID=UPI001374A15F|nr:DNA adenine methylase [Borrelia turcica]